MLKQISEQTKSQQGSGHRVTIEDVKRVLEVGRILLSVLTPEEVEDLQKELCGRNSRCATIGLGGQAIGNAGVT